MDVQNCLLAMVNELGAGYQFAGVATEQTNPGTPDYNVFYIAGPGTYANFGGEIIATGFIGVFSWNGTWSVGRIAVSSGGGGGAAWGQTTNNYSPLTIGAETKTVALQGHGHDYSTILGSVSGTKEDGVVVQWDASLNSGQGGWKYAVISGGGGGGTGYLPLTAGSGNALTGTLYAQDIVPKTAQNNYALGSSTRIWKNAYIDNVNAGKVFVSDWSGLGADYLAYIDTATGEIKAKNTLAVSDIVTLSGAQTISGSKTFTANILANNILPRADSSYNLGSYDNATPANSKQWQNLYFNNALFLKGKNIIQNNGSVLLIANGLKETHPTYFYAPSWHFWTRLSGASSDTNVFSIYQGSARFRVNILPTDAAGESTDIGSTSAIWNQIFVKTWRPTSASANYPKMTYNTADSRWEITGDVWVDGDINANGATNYPDLTAPKLRIYVGTNSLGQSITPFMRITHPLLNDARFDATPVLMIWSKRRGRNRQRPEELDPLWQYCRGRWGEARGKLATTAPMLFTVGGNANLGKYGYRTLSFIRTFILQHFVCGKGLTAAAVQTMTYSQFQQNTHVLFRFGGIYEYTGSDAAFKGKTKAHRLFGVAIRYTNPEFLEAVDPEHALVETTREIESPTIQGRKIPRYIYSEVTPFRVFCHLAGAGENEELNTLGIEMQPITAPHT